jgi:predicted ester cyclase
VAIAAFFLSACNNKSETTAKTGDSTATILTRNKQAALNANTAFTKGDIDGSVKDYASDFVEYGSGESKPQKNLDSIKISTKSFLKAFPDFKGEDMHAVAEGDSVIITAKWSGTFKSDYMKMKANGKSFKVNDVDIFTFNKDGKITSHSSIQGVATFLNALDLPMIPKKK